MWYCKMCKEECEDTDAKCWQCGTGREGSLPAEKLSASVQAETAARPGSAEPSGREGGSIVSRYADAYLTARSTAALGTTVKIIALIISGAIILTGFTASPHSTKFVFGGIILGALAGIPLFVLGMLLSALGKKRLSAEQKAVAALDLKLFTMEQNLNTSLAQVRTELSELRSDLGKNRELLDVHPELSEINAFLRELARRDEQRQHAEQKESDVLEARLAAMEQSLNGRIEMVHEGIVSVRGDVEKYQASLEPPNLDAYAKLRDIKVVIEENRKAVLEELNRKRGIFW